MSEDDPTEDVDPIHGELEVERFVEELEQKMISGYSRHSIQYWAKTEYQVNEELLKRFQDMVHRGWAIDSQSSHLLKARRDHLRLKYLEVYEFAVASEDYLPAVKALDSIAKLDGLTDPDLNLTQINVGAGGHPGQITNSVRERIQRLSDTMKHRAEQRALQNSKIIDVSTAKKNGTNGK